MRETLVLSPLSYTTVIAFWGSLSVTVAAALCREISTHQRIEVGGVLRSNR